VPDDKNPLAPFLLGNDKNNKPMTYNGKRGTYALMTDGSVRFIDQNVNPDLFKAMCTVGGPVPDEFNPGSNPQTPLVPAPKKEDLKFDDPPPARPPVKGVPDKDEPAPAKVDVSNWVTFKSPAGYSVKMPKQPETKSLDLPVGGKVHVSAVQLNKGAALVTTAVKLPPEQVEAAKTPEGIKLLASLSAPGVKILRATPVKHGQLDGTELQIEANSPLGKVGGLTRLFLVNDLLINLQAVGTGPVPPEAQAFFDSLKVGD